MSDEKTTKAVVIGAGPAGLAAGVKLLEEGPGELEVEIIHMGHHIGGKAASYPDPQGSGYTVEHGWHMVVGFYRRMRELMRRAGVRPAETLQTMQGKAHVYEEFDGSLHHLDWDQNSVEFAFDWLSYDGLPTGDRLNFGRMMAQAFAQALSGEDLAKYDDICFQTWAIEQGLRPHVTDYSLFRFFQEAYFNFPYAISAYHVLKTMKLMRSPERAEMFVASGGLSEEIWQPIAEYFEKLGGTIRPMHLVKDWVYEGRKISGLRVAHPDGAGHNFGQTSWQTDEIPSKKGTRRTYGDFDFVVSTIPHAVFVTMNREDERMWNSSYFSRLKNLRSVATISMMVFTEEECMRLPGPVFGLPAPLGIGVNMTPYWDEYEKESDLGAAIHFVGQETGFESWSDEQIINYTLDNFSKLSEVGDLREKGIEHIEFHRNKSNFERLLLSEPGVNQFRPGPRTPFKNLFLAGDWVRNSVDVVTMEGAIASGYQAAELLLEAI